MALRSLASGQEPDRLRCLFSFVLLTRAGSAAWTNADGMERAYGRAGGMRGEDAEPSPHLDHLDRADPARRPSLSRPRLIARFASSRRPDWGWATPGSL